MESLRISAIGYLVVLLACAAGCTVSAAAGGTPEDLTRTADAPTDAPATEEVAPEPSIPEPSATVPEASTCLAPGQAETFQLPTHASYAHFKFAASMQTYEARIVVHTAPTNNSAVGMYVAPFSGAIDGTPAYLGLQTDVADNARGISVGKGVVFSRWDSQDPSDVRVAPGGFAEIGAHEGKFVGVRITYPWEVGEYRVRLVRAEADGARDWFELSIQSARQPATSTLVGALRFPRKKTSTPAAIDPNVTAFSEVYKGATTYAEVPAWVFDLHALGDTHPAVAIQTEYPAFPYERFRNVDTYYQPKLDAVRIAFGGQTAQCHKAQRVK